MCVEVEGARKSENLLWLLVHDGLLTNLRRHGRHLSTHPYCQRCNRKVEESALHVIRDCLRIVGLWREVFGNSLNNSFSLQMSGSGCWRT